MSKYNIGDKVRIINHRGLCWNSEGLMDRYCGKVLTIMDVEEYEGDEALYTMFECPNWAWNNDDIAELVDSAATNPVNTTNTTTTEEETEMKKETTTPTTNKVALIDTPMEFNLEMATLTSEFTDNILKLADKFNTDRRKTMEVVAATIVHTSEDDFFWDFIVPMQELTNKIRDKAGK